MINALLAAGAFVAVPITGWVLLGPLRLPIPAIARPALWVSAGLAVWSAVLLISLSVGGYHPELIGAAGWMLVAVLLAARKVTLPRVPPLSRADGFVLGGVMIAALLAAAFPADPFTTGDQGTYASHALYMVNHGRLDVPPPWGIGASPPPGFQGYVDIYATEQTLTVKHGHLFRAWLAQTFAVGGYEGLVRLNIVLGALGLLAIYGLMKRYVNARIGALLILFLAFNPAQIWITRQALSEVLAQLLVWSGLLLLTAYLSRASPRWGLWAGILLGASAFVRIDSFLLVPFLLVGHAMWHVLRRQRQPGPSWKHVYVGATATFSLALAFHLLFSRPYLVVQGTQMAQVGALAIGSAMVLGLTRWTPAMSRLARAALARPVIVASLLGVLAGLTAYAYFLRPTLPPFVVLDSPGNPFHGLRSRVEDALPNLGRYLTPAAVWGALAGWSIVFVATIRRPRMIALVPILTIALGCAVVYTWNQAALPVHFWAIRRFMPVIIPAMILFTGIAATVGLLQLSLPGRRLARRAAAALGLVFTLAIGVPTYAVRDYQGSYAAISEFADSLPTSGQILAVDDYQTSANIWKPLLLAFDRPIIPLDVATDKGRQEALYRLRGASQDQPVTIVTAADRQRFDAVVGLRTAETTWSRTVIDTYIVPVPRTTHDEILTLTTIQATGLSTLGVQFGGKPQWVAIETGFHPPELVNGRSLRWTDGHGRLSIPIEGSSAPGRISISIADTGPEGGRLQVILSETTLFDGIVPAGSWSAEYELGGLANVHPGGNAEVELISSTFARGEPDPSDRGSQFGMQIESVMLMPRATSERATMYVAAGSGSKPAQPSSAERSRLAPHLHCSFCLVTS